MDTNHPEMKDRNGLQLKVNDTITFNGGEGQIIAYLGAGTPRGGAVVRVKIHKQTVDIALLLSQVEYKRPNSPTHVSKFGM